MYGKHAKAEKGVSVREAVAVDEDGGEPRADGGLRVVNDRRQRTKVLLAW